MATAVCGLYRPLRGHAGPGLGTHGKVLVFLLVGIQAVFCWMARERSLRGEVDLRAFYAAGDTVRRGQAHSLYNPVEEAETQQRLFPGGGRTLPFLYPAFAALPFVPLSLLPYRTSFPLVVLANLACLLLCAHRLAASDALSDLSSPWLFALSLGFFPVAMALMQGQISFFLLLCFVFAHQLMQRRRFFLAGLCLSLALAKFQLVLPVVALYLLGRRFRLVCGFLTGGAFLAAVSLLLAGAAGTRDYVARLRGAGSSMLLDPRTAQAHFGMQASAEPNLHGLMLQVAGPGPLSVLLTAAFSLAVLGWTARHKPSIATALPAAMLVSYHMQPYDLVLLLLPLSMLLGRPAREALRSRRALRFVAYAGGTLFFFPVAPLLLVYGQTASLALGTAGVALCAGAVLSTGGLRVISNGEKYLGEGCLSGPAGLP